MKKVRLSLRNREKRSAEIVAKFAKTREITPSATLFGNLRGVKGRRACSRVRVEKDTFSGTH